jgi:hypothetical protein
MPLNEGIFFEKIDLYKILNVLLQINMVKSFIIIRNKAFEGFK